MMQRLIIIALLWSLGSTIYGQCCVLGNFPMMDFNITTVELEVSGALVDDLSDPNQGVCRVSIEFDHDLLGDLIIEMISPSGQEVTLVGPGNGASSGLTDFTIWDIDFVQCGAPANPDDDFADTWDSEQSWGILGNYDGSYYPFFRCLEDFDTGPVNGTWRLRLIDTDIFDMGELRKFRIEFCDGTGLDCEDCFECEADPGSLDPMVQAYCINEMPLRTNIAIVDSSEVDTQIFRQSYYLLEDSLILAQYFDDSLTLDLPVGQYTICAFNYLLLDSSLVPEPGDTIIVDSLRQSLLDDEAGYCARFSTECYAIEIVDLPDTVQFTEILCRGDSVEFEGRFVDSTGMYLALRLGAACDTVVTLDLQVQDEAYDLQIEITDTCNQESSWYVVGSYDSLIWRSASGAELSRLDTVMIQGSENICVDVYRGACIDVLCDSVAFAESALLEIEGDTVFCIGDSVLLRSSLELDSYDWSGVGDSDSFWLSTPGLVVLRGRDSLGCELRAELDVRPYSTSPIDITGDDLICFGAEAILEIDSDLYSEISWGPFGQMSSSIVLTDSATVTVSARDSNGCQVSGALRVERVDPPEAILAGRLEVCSTDPARAVLDLSDAFVSGDTVGIWQDLDGSGAVGVFPILDFTGVTPQSYQFAFISQVAMTPCAEDTVLMTVEVFDCSCPRLRITPDSVSICEDLGSLDLSDFLISDSIGTWSIASAPSGSQAILEDSTLTFSGSDTGAYLMVYTLNTPNPLCRGADTLSASIDFDFEFVSSVDTIRLCQGIDSLLRLDEYLTDPSAEDWNYIGENLSMQSAFDPTTSAISLSAVDAGSYQFDKIRMAENSCGNDTVTIVLLVDQTPQVSVPLDTTISCLTQQLSITASVDTDEFSWSSIDGRILGSDTSASVLIQGPGTYVLTASSTQACSLDVSTEVILIENLPDLTFDFSPAVCPGAQDGWIDIVDTIGGTGRILVFLDQVQLFEDQLTELSAGSYVFSVVDELGCTSADTVVILPGTEDLVIDLLGESPILEGDTAMVMAQLSDLSLVDRWIWRLNGLELTDSLLEVNLVLTESSTISLETISTDGCAIETELLIEIIDADRIYVPNVFSPNGDERNDGFTAYGISDVWTISTMKIYDRWGNLSYEATNLPLNDPVSGWNGISQGLLAPEGVYIYQIELVNRTGQQQVLSGGVTLIR